MYDMYIYICIYIYTYTHMYKHIYIYVYTHREYINLGYVETNCFTLVVSITDWFLVPAQKRHPRGCRTATKGVASGIPTDQLSVSMGKSTGAGFVSETRQSNRRLMRNNPLINPLIDIFFWGNKKSPIFGGSNSWVAPPCPPCPTRCCYGLL